MLIPGRVALLLYLLFTTLAQTPDRAPGPISSPPPKESSTVRPRRDDEWKLVETGARVWGGGRPRISSFRSNQTPLSQGGYASPAPLDDSIHPVSGLVYRSFRRTPFDLQPRNGMEKPLEPLVGRVSGKPMDKSAILHKASWAVPRWAWNRGVDMSEVARLYGGVEPVYEVGLVDHICVGDFMIVFIAAVLDMNPCFWLSGVQKWGLSINV